MISKERGMFLKYFVKRCDGKPMPEGCVVLEWKDKNALPGIAAFSRSVRAEGYIALADDLDKRLAAKGYAAEEPAQGEVEDGLVKLELRINEMIKDINRDDNAYRMALAIIDEITAIKDHPAPSVSTEPAQGDGLREAVEVARKKCMVYTPPILRPFYPDKGWYESKAFLNNTNWHLFTWPTKKQCNKFAIEWMKNHPDCPAAKEGAA